MREKNVLYKGKSIYYCINGTGKPVVFLHGFTESSEIWNDFGSELSTEFCVITIDLPGHGKSDCIAQEHSMELMADCVKQILESEVIGQCVMIGHSMGGYVTLAFAEKFPESILGLGLFHSSAFADTDEGKSNRDRTIEFIRNNHSSFISSFIPDLFAPANQIIYKNDINKLVSAARNMTSESIIAAQLGMRNRPDRTHVLSNASYPVLFIAGKLDSRVPYNKVLQQVALPADAVLLSLGNAAHMGYIEARDKTLYAIKVFLQEIY
jgi:pimeloyl-ACP methyl ester carboxylesterase